MFKKKKFSSNEEQVSIFYYWYIYILIKINNFRSKRPHRSFRVTRRRDYVRRLNISGYFKFTGDVFGVIFSHKKIFFSMIFSMMIANIIFIGLLDGDFVNSLRDVVNATSEKVYTGFWGDIGKAGIVIASVFTTGGLVRNPNEMQQVAMFMMVIFSWLTIVQLCRDIYSGKKNIKFRDALYTCGYPIVPMLIISLVILVQFIPAIIGVVLLSASKISNFASSPGVEQMVFFAAVLLLFSMSAYWIMGSLFAMIIATNPRYVYPMKALSISGDMVSQRRLAILFRILWLAMVIIFFWFIMVVPVVILTDKIDFLKDLPIVQLVMLFTTSSSIIFASCYIYTLYRKIVDADQRR